MGVDVASRYKVAGALRTKKAIEVAVELVFKYPKVFQCDNGSVSKSDVTKLLEKHSVHVQRATAEYKYTYKPLKKSWQNNCLIPWMVKIFKTQKKYQQHGLEISITF